ncbi:hypothetical protein GCM10011488_48380 [Steroidobacter agaridevorans]|nr:hypothetical protein GCM10011488_48380 [Steroidobacter agaridevorans]
MLSLSFAVVAFMAQESSAADLAKGKESFLSAGCHHCHGQAAQGARGPTMAAMKYPYEAFEIFVRRPVGGGMPPYSATTLTDAELRDIYAYLTSLPGPAKELPELLR